MKTLVYFILVFMVAVPAVAQVDDNAVTNSVRGCPPIPNLSPEACPGGSVVRGGVGLDGCPLPPKCGESEPGGLLERIKDIGEKFRQEKKEAKKEVKDVRAYIEQFREDQLKILGEKKNEFRGMIEAKREEFKKAVEQKREEVKKKIEEKREQLRENLLKVKDEKKREIVERIDQRIVELNKNVTDHLSEVLVKLENVLLNISSRADKAEVKGGDVSSVRSAVEDAKSKIESARTAIQSQVSKVYPITISSEETLKVNVGAARQALHSDLKQLRDIVKEVRDAVHGAATTLAGVADKSDLWQTNSNAPDGSQ